MGNSAHIRADMERERELRERAIEYFTGNYGTGDAALAGLKNGRQIDVRGGPLTKITHILNLPHLDYLIDRWRQDEFEYQDAVNHAMDKDD